jgi:long-subunit fatty acid transport protein
MAGVAALLVAVPSVSNAQTNGPTGVSARVGIFFPTSNLARNLGKNWFAFGADYKLNTAMMSAPTEDTLAYLSISADYYSKNNSSALPIALNYNVRASQIVWSAGVGLDIVRFGANTSGFAAQVGAAYEFGPGPTPFFVQAKYFFSSKSDLNGFGVFLGARF